MATVNKVSDGSVRLNLTKDEANTLSAILAYVGGSDFNSPRRHAREVLQALGDAGFDWDEGAEIEKLIDQDNYGPGVFFKDYPEPFVPGYYRSTNAGNGTRATAVWFDSFEALDNYAEDEELHPNQFKRVNVTPAD